MNWAEILNHPTTPIVVIGMVFSVGAWAGHINLFKKQVLKFMVEIREDIKKILQLLPRTPVASQSPLRLNDLGETISKQLKAKDWARATAPDLTNQLTVKRPYEIQEACFERVSKEDFNADIPMARRILDCAFEHGLKEGQVRMVLGIELRDAVFEDMNVPLSS